MAHALWFRGVARLHTVAVASLGQSMTGVALLGLVAVLASVFTLQWFSTRE